ncbi:unnamed protein product [Diplocarpon coronariae]
MKSPKLATIGRAIGQPPVPPDPSVVTTLTITSPTTSSIIAAPTSTTPTFVLCNPAEDRIANVVPREVEQSEAPAENAASGLGYVVPERPEKGNARRIKDRARGIRRPTVATDIERYTVFRRSARSVLSPPSKTSPISPR